MYGSMEMSARACTRYVIRTFLIILSSGLMVMATSRKSRSRNGTRGCVCCFYFVSVVVRLLTEWQPAADIEIYTHVHPSSYRHKNKHIHMNRIVRAARRPTHLDAPGGGGLVGAEAVVLVQPLKLVHRLLVELPVVVGVVMKIGGGNVVCVSMGEEVGLCVAPIYSNVAAIPPTTTNHNRMSVLCVRRLVEVEIAAKDLVGALPGEHHLDPARLDFARHEEHGRGRADLLFRLCRSICAGSVYVSKQALVAVFVCARPEGWASPSSPPPAVVRG